MPEKPHAAAERAVARINNRPLTEPEREAIITDEYTPLVEAVQAIKDAYDSEANSDVAAQRIYDCYLKPLFPALKGVVGDA